VDCRTWYGAQGGGHVRVVVCQSPCPCPCRDDGTPNELNANATQRNASIGIGRHRPGTGHRRSWHTAFGRLLSRTLLFYILGSTHRTEQKK